MVISWSAQAQTTINNYKYVLLPEKFDFQKSPNQYGLNLMSKAFLENKGFTVYYDNPELPKELAGDRCNALKAEIVERKAIFTTNLTLFLKDCQGNVVFKSKEGKSREKEYSTAYDEALRDAFSSLNALAYAYNGTTPVRARPVVDTAVAAPALPAVAVATEEKPAAGTLYAQPTATGFQLIDTTPKIIYTLLKTSAPGYFIAQKDAAQGIVFKKNGDWYFEYYQDGKLVADKLLIKF